jgi:uncharacterized RDD family membrane protein YckC
VSRQAGIRAPGLVRRLACGIYELLILSALLLVATFPFLAVVGDATSGAKRYFLQAYVLAMAGAYLVGFWTHGGQTLAMKTWRIRVVSEDGGHVGLMRGIRRYVIALAGVAAFGLGFLWALVDRDRQFLHDRLAGTRLVTTQ